MAENNNSNNNSNNNNNDNNQNRNNPQSSKHTTLIVVFIAVIMSLIFWLQFNRYKESGQKEVPYNQFIQMVKDKEVDDVEIYNNKIFFVPVQDGKKQEIKYFVYRTDDYQLIERLEKTGVKFTAINEGQNAFIKEVLLYVIVLGAFYFILMLMMRRMGSKGGGIFGARKINAKEYGMLKKTGITFKNVAR